MGISARRVTIFLALLFGVASLLASQAGAWSQEASPEEAIEAENGKTYAAGRLIVTYEPGATEAVESEAVEQVAGEVEGNIRGVEAEVVSLPGTADAPVGEAREDLRLAREKLEDEPGVAAVDYDYLREASYAPADPA